MALLPVLPALKRSFSSLTAGMSRRRNGSSLARHATAAEGKTNHVVAVLLSMFACPRFREACSLRETYCCSRTSFEVYDRLVRKVRPGSGSYSPNRVPIPYPVVVLSWRSSMIAIGLSLALGRSGPLKLPVESRTGIVGAKRRACIDTGPPPEPYPLLTRA